MHIKLAATIVIITLCSCVSHPPDQAIGDVLNLSPSNWSATKAGQSGVDSAWVKRFGDTQLNQLVAEALISNQDIKIASERVYRASQAAGVSDALSKPQVDLSLSSNRNKLNFIGFPFGGSTISETNGVSLGVSWEPDLWGRYRAGKSAAIAEWQAGGAEYRAARASLAAQVCKAWFALAEAREQLTLAQEALSIRKKTEGSVQERFERDLRAEGGSASQLRLAQTDVATTKSDLSAREGNLESARRRLELLLGRYPSARIVGKASLPRAPSRPPSGVPSGLLLRRPDIIAAERRYAASSKSIKEAQLAVFPSFTITGSGGTTTESLSNILNSDFGVWAIGGDIVAPILTGGRIRNEIRVRKSSQREALATLHKTVINAFGEVEEALAVERLLTKREGEIKEALDLAREASTAAEEEFRRGSGDLLTLFSAQTRSIQLDSQYTSLKHLRLTNRVDLHLALGGGFKLNR